MGLTERKEPTNLGRNLSRHWSYSDSVQMQRLKKAGIKPTRDTSKAPNHGIPADLDNVCSIIMTQGMQAYLDYRKNNPTPLRLKPRSDGEPGLPPLPKFHKARVQAGF